MRSSSSASEPALADFGVAALRDAAAGSASPLSGLTLLHAAPEVILGHHASPASDVYGLVSTLYELLGGHAPHFITADEDPAVVQRRVLNDPPPALQAPGVTRRLSDLVTQALSKVPDSRPPTARDLAQQLRLVERESGWPLTPCRIADEPDLPIPDAPPPPPPSTPSRAARMTGLPNLGLGARPLSSGEHDAVDRDLEPLGPRETVLLPGRGSGPATEVAPNHEREAASADPSQAVSASDNADVLAMSDPAAKARFDQPSEGPSETPVNEASAETPAREGPQLMRPPSGVLPGFSGSRTSGDRPESEPGSRPTEATQGRPAASPATQPQPGTPRTDRDASPPAPPSASSSPPPTAPAQAASAAPVPSPLAPTAPTPDPTAPLWGFEERRGLHETIGLASSNQGRTSPRDESDDDDDGKGRKRRRRRKARRNQE